MYVLLEFWQKIMAIPIMNPLSWFMTRLMGARRGQAFITTGRSDELVYNQPERRSNRLWLCKSALRSAHSLLLKERWNHGLDCHCVLKTSR